MYCMINFPSSVIATLRHSNMSMTSRQYGYDVTAIWVWRHGNIMCMTSRQYEYDITAICVWRHGNMCMTSQQYVYHVTAICVSRHGNMCMTSRQYEYAVSPLRWPIRLVTYVWSRIAYILMSASSSITVCLPLVHLAQHPRLGGQIWPQNGSHWPKIGTNPGLFQIRFQYILSRLIWKSPGFVPYWANLTDFIPKSEIPVLITNRSTTL